MFTFLSETGIRNLANDCPRYTQDNWKLTDEQAVALRTSQTFPNDGLPLDRNGESKPNGKSTGIAQQISKEVNAVVGIKWGWGSVADTMHVPTATRMLAEALPVTTELVYVDDAGTRYELSSSIARDVLVCQRPLASEAASSNYSASQVAAAVLIARGGDLFFTRSVT